MSTDRQVGEKSELLGIIRQSVERAGAKAEVSNVVKGRSGAKHIFDLIITKDGSRIPIDVKMADSESVELTEVLETYAKALDTRSKPVIIIAVPGVTSEARKSAAAFGILLVEGKDSEQVVEGLGRALDSLLPGR